MRKLIITVAYTVFVFIVHAQVLYTTTSTGGKGGGTISKLEAGGSTLTSVFNFDTPDGETGQASLVQASDGKLYGMTYTGGVNRSGTIFSYDPATAVYLKIYDFNDVSGSFPKGSLIQATDGKLYGMTYSGGSSDGGVIFAFNPATSVYTKLVDLSVTIGRHPNGSLMQAKDGKLYGMTYNGGAFDYGVIFSYNITTGIYTKLKDFDGTTGKYPYGDFIQASDGKLYAMTYNGGINDAGIIFSYNPLTTTFTKLKDLDNANGSYPYGSLMQAADGKLYGMTWGGGSNSFGVIFSYSPVSNSYIKLKDLNVTDGYHPYGNLTQAADGKLYGMTIEGGNYSKGALFSYNILSTVYTKLINFDSNIGANPKGSLTKTNDGKLYSMTSAGGNIDVGVIFSYNIGTSAYVKLRDFGANVTGNLMNGGVIKDSTGKLYGMTGKGGSYGKGVIFSFNPVTSTYTKLMDFNGINGEAPYGSLMLSPDGSLYGMTFRGGTKGAGVMFSYNPATATYTKIRDFDYTTGGSPYGSLMQATDGKLYGMTHDGGTQFMGVIFSYNPATNAYKKLKDFDNFNGAYPQGSLMQATNGKLYGVTYNGGSNGLGVLFSYNPSNGVYTKLKDFDVSNGANPNCTLIQATNGKLYGMTPYGGNSFGCIFSYDLNTGIFTKAKDFDNTNGAYPKGSLMQASDGKLYGMTSSGGTYGAGVAFSFDLVTNTYIKVQDFSGTNGKYPQYTFFTEVKPTTTIKISNASIQEGNSGQQSMIFNVTLSATASQTVTVNYNTQNNTAIAPTDYVVKSGTITFAPGVRKQAVSVLINGDSQVERDEKFKVILNNPINAAIADSIGVGTILNDDNGLISTIIQNKPTSHSPEITSSPNPASKVLSVQLIGLTNSAVLQLTDANGRILSEQKVLFNSTGKVSQQIDVSNFASGSYYLMLTIERGNRITRKVVITH